jgi:hypothetical protein
MRALASAQGKKGAQLFHPHCPWDCAEVSRILCDDYRLYNTSDISFDEYSESAVLSEIIRTLQRDHASNVLGWSCHCPLSSPGQELCLFCHNQSTSLKFLDLLPEICDLWHVSRIEPSSTAYPSESKAAFLWTVFSCKN